MVTLRVAIAIFKAMTGDLVGNQAEHHHPDHQRIDTKEYYQNQGRAISPSNEPVHQGFARSRGMLDVAGAVAEMVEESAHRPKGQHHIGENVPRGFHDRATHGPGKRQYRTSVAEFDQNCGTIMATAG
jgi:hypothetical protein